MAAKLPPEAFDFYLGLGPARSYSAVAERYGVSKRSVTKCASREGWQERLSGIQRQARETADQKAVEAMEAVTARHLKIMRAVEGKAIEGLRGMVIDRPRDVLAALELAFRHERQLVGSSPVDPATNIIRELPTEVLRKLVMQVESEKTTVTVSATGGTPQAGRVLDPAPPAPGKP